MRVPDGLDWWRDVPGGAAWLARLPMLVDSCVERWSLRLGEPFESAHISLVFPAALPDGTRAVLKVNFPEPESEHEADALEHWRGHGAALLLDHDPGLRALLVERCEPGTQLWEVADDEEACTIAAGVLLRLSRPVTPGRRYRLLADEAARWARELAKDWEGLGRPFERSLLDEAVAACRELGPSQGEAVLLHQEARAGHGAVCAPARGWLQRQVGATCMSPLPRGLRRQSPIIPAWPGRTGSGTASRSSHRSTRPTSGGWGSRLALS